MQQYPVEAFFSDPVRTGASLSPDGTRIGYLAPAHGRLNVWVEPLDGGPAVCVTHDVRRPVRNFRWTGDPRWLLYLQDDDGDENWHVFRVDLDNPSAPAVDLTPFPGVQAGVELLADPATAYLMMNRRDPEELDLHRLDLGTGEIELVVENPGNVVRWITSASGAVFAMTMDEEGDETLCRWDAGSGLTPLLTFDGTDNPSAGPWSTMTLVATPSGDGLWVGSNRHSEQTELYHVSAADGTETFLARHDSLSVDSSLPVVPAPAPLIVSRRTGRLLGVRYLGERQVVEALDPGFAEVLAEVSALSDGDVATLSSDKEERRWLVSFTHDTDPEVTYLWDRETRRGRLLFRPYPHLDPAQLAPMRPVTVTSRDGWDLPSYLTLPQGVEPTGLPLVLLVHGGPWARDRWGYNSRVQFLANRGYAVLQVNFRGSTGYGKSFVRAAVGEFAGAMHDDLVDAVEWAVKQGIADPTRVAVFGGSYGGYSALVGATFTPEVFAAAVDYCGISDLVSFTRTVPPYWRKFMTNSFLRYSGDPDRESAQMLARSPISRLDAVCRPLLVIQGAKDPRVVQAESDNIVAALRARGADVEYLLKDDDGHGFANPQNNIDAMRAVERFLARTLAP